MAHFDSRQCSLHWGGKTLNYWWHCGAIFNDMERCSWLVIFGKQEEVANSMIICVYIFLLFIHCFSFLKVGVYIEMSANIHSKMFKEYLSSGFLTHIYIYFNIWAFFVNSLLFVRIKSRVLKMKKCCLFLLKNNFIFFSSIPLEKPSPWDTHFIINSRFLLLNLGQHFIHNTLQTESLKKKQNPGFPPWQNQCAI